MLQLQLTLDSLAENVALDEALLDAAENDELSAGVLRLWESPSYGVVLGRSSDAAVEVDLAACRRDQVPVLRRSSGGGTIVAGPGCLMYALVLSLQEYPQLHAIDATHRFVLERIVQMLSVHVEGLSAAGTSDLAFNLIGTKLLLKFSGNAMRRKRCHTLYHGTLLYDFDLDRVSRWLATPTRVPDYRRDRHHQDFVANLPLQREVITTSLLDGWSAHEALSTWPQTRTTELVQTKYQDDPKWVLHTPTKSSPL